MTRTKAPIANPRWLVSHTHHVCKDGTKHALPDEFVCRCGVPSPTDDGCVALARRPPAELQGGSERVIGSPMAWCYPIPVARIQPRNDVPLWARRFFASFERRLEVPDGAYGIPAILTWGVAMVGVCIALLALWTWNGAGPEIVVPARKQLRGG